jgi:hypothetical protein
MSTSTSSWQDTAALARSQLSAAIAVYDWPTPEVADGVTDVTGISLEAFMSPLHLEITETSDVGVLLENIASSKWLSEEVLVCLPRPRRPRLSALVLIRCLNDPLPCLPTASLLSSSSDRP